MDKPKVDEILGIPPAIAIEQSNPVKSTRSTVGTMTEINDYLKLLFPRLAHAFCPSCEREIRPETSKSIMEHVFAGHAGEILPRDLFGVRLCRPRPTPPSSSRSSSSRATCVWLCTERPCAWMNRPR